MLDARSAGLAFSSLKSCNKKLIPVRGTRRSEKRSLAASRSFRTLHDDLTTWVFLDFLC